MWTGTAVEPFSEIAIEAQQLKAVFRKTVLL